MGYTRHEAELCSPLHNAKTGHLQAVGRWWLLWEFGDDTMADREACIEAYLQHNAHIEASVPPEQLLVWQAKDGWEPLCRWTLTCTVLRARACGAVPNGRSSWWCVVDAETIMLLWACRPVVPAHSRLPEACCCCCCSMRCVACHRPALQQIFAADFHEEQRPGCAQVSASSSPAHV